MTQKDEIAALKNRIAELERRIQALEARVPQEHHYHYHAPAVIPPAQTMPLVAPRPMYPYIGDPIPPSYTITCQATARPGDVIC